MSKTTNQIRNLTMMALFVAIEIILLVTPFGYLRIGPLSATLMHVPVTVSYTHLTLPTILLV